MKIDQKGLCIWLTGLSGSGKTTIAHNLKKHLFHNGFFSIILDGDEIRSGLNKDLGYSVEDRMENIRRVAEINKLLIKNNIIVINSFITPLNIIRKLIFDIIGRNYVFMIYVYCSIDTCIKRDVKGFYKLAKENTIKDFTGINQTFEEPDDYDLLVNTEHYEVYKIVADIYINLKNKIQ